MKAELREYLVNHRAGDELAEFSDGDSLLEAGVIDSMAMVDLIAHLEQTYGITVEEDDMVPENFDSIDAIAAYVKRRLEQRPSAASSSAPTE